MGLPLHNLNLGAETAECLRFIISTNPEIRRLALAVIERPAPLQERLSLTPSEQGLVDLALSLREKTHLPFWDALHLASFGMRDVSERLLDQARFHQPNAGKEQWVDATCVVDGHLKHLSDSHVGPSMLSVLSEVDMNSGERRHLVFIDFHVPVSIENTAIVCEVAKSLVHYPALIIESGASYHLIGTELVDVKQFRDTLASALLFGPLTDRAYIAHQLLEGRAALRFSKGGHFNFVPRLLAVSRGSAGRG